MNTQERISNLLIEIQKPENEWLKVKILDFDKTCQLYQFYFESFQDDIFDDLNYEGFLNIDESKHFIDIFKNVADYEGVSGFEYEVIMNNIANRLNQNDSH